MSDLLDTPEAGPRVIRGGTLRIAGYGAGVGIALASSAVLFHYLGPADSGRYVTVLTLSLLCAGLTEMGITAISMREYAVRPPAERDLMLRNLNTLRLLLTTAGAGIATLYAALAGFGATLVAGTAIAGLAVVATMLQQGVATVLMTELRLGWVTAAEVLRQLVGALWIIALVVAGADLIGFFPATVLGSLAALALTVYAVRNPALLKPAWTPPILRQLARDALPFAAAAIAGSLYLRIGVLIVERIEDEIQTGYFATSYRVIEALVAVPALAISTAFPVLARAARDDATRLAYAVQRSFEGSLLLGAGVAVMLGVGAPVAIEVIGGEAEFGPAADVLRWHAVAVCFAFVSAVLIYALLALRAHRAILVAMLSGLVVVVAGTVVLTEADGARGAAIAAAIGELALAVTGIVALARARDGFALRLGVVPRIALAAALAVLPALVLPALPAAILGGLVFGVAAALLRAVPEEIWAELRALRR